MATIRYRKIPINELTGLHDSDLRVLDLALAAMKDSVQRGDVTLSSYDSESLYKLHQQILQIKHGETEDEE